MAELEASPGRDPYNWNSLDNYLFLHRRHLDIHPFVRVSESHRSFEITDQPRRRYDRIALDVVVVCTNGLVLEITKIGDVDRTPARRVRMLTYSYNAHFPGGNNALRYDNTHQSEPHAYHRHVFDPEAGDQIIRENLTRTQFPVMHEVLDELMQMFPPR